MYALRAKLGEKDAEVSQLRSLQQTPAPFADALDRAEEHIRRGSVVEAENAQAAASSAQALLEQVEAARKAQDDALRMHARFVEASERARALEESRRPPSPQTAAQLRVDEAREKVILLKAKRDDASENARSSDVYPLSGARDAVADSLR